MLQLLLFLCNHFQEFLGMHRPINVFLFFENLKNKSLLQKGLVFQIFQKQENIYRAVHPQKLLEVITEKEQQLQHVLPELQSLYEQKPLTEAAFIYKGVEG